MKIFLITVSFVILMFSCGKAQTLISNEGVGNIKLGKILDFEYDNLSLDITFDERNNVRTIIISNSKYKTIDSFGVDTNLNDIIKKYDHLKINNDFNVSKGKHSIMKLGTSVSYGNIIFVDSDEDETVDYIILNDD